jgi:hypothetical protein
MEDNIVPVKRGRGRPKGSKNKSGSTTKVVVVATGNDVPVEAKKRGRPKGSKNYNVLTAVAEPKPERVRKDYDARIPRKDALRQLTGKLVRNFSGEDYADALDYAYAWAKLHDITLLDYYEQEAHNKSIIVSY